MKSMHIDFAPRGLLRELGSMGSVSLMFSVLAAILCAGALWAVNDAVRRQDGLRAEEGRRQAARAAESEAARAVSREQAIPEEQASAVNGAIQRLNLPWTGLLDAIEKATPPSVALLELEPDPKRSLVKGVAEARTSAAMTDYIHRLKQQSFFGNVVLTRHANNEEAESRVNSVGGNRGTNKWLRFEFEAEWRQGNS